MNDKELVAEQAAKEVEDGMIVGLGTGSTANLFIEQLARRQRDENLQITTVASSFISMLMAKELDLPVLAIEQLNHLDLYVDGADEVTSDNTLLKGQGADLVKEKILANASEKFIVLIDQSKMVSRIGENFMIPVEVMPCAWQLVQLQLKKLGGHGKLRKNNNGGVAVSSHGSLILDVKFNEALNSEELSTLLNNIPGVVEHGVFHHLADVVFVAVKGKVNEIFSKD